MELVTESDNPIVPTTHGYIKGAKRLSHYKESYYSFEKIPYAKAPLGRLRFKAPEPTDVWSDILECTQCATKPLQKNIFDGEIEGSEDCLYLNVYVKKLVSVNLLPVLFYIYGGDFQNGEASRDVQGPDYFMKQNVILVTVNYRLGALGFLSLKNAALQVAGNAGLKDLLAALSWFKQNSINFNGNPQNITLIGHGAGAVAAHYLMLSEKTKGLFHKAILMSGTVCNKGALTRAGDYAYRLAVANGYKLANTDEAVYEFLLQLDGSDLVDKDILTPEQRLNDISFVFGPTVEPYISDHCLIPMAPMTMLENTWSNGIPVIIGGTSFEGLLRYPLVKADHGFIDLFKTRPELVLPLNVRKTQSLAESQRVGRQIIEMHMAGAELNFNNVFRYLNMISIRNGWQGFHRCILARLKYALTTPTYVYRFDFDSPTFNLNRLKYCGPRVRGVAHGDDLSYLFFGCSSSSLPQECEESFTIDRMVGMWTSFAQISNPNCKKIAPILWQSANQFGANTCLNISYTLDMRVLPEAEQLECWHNLYKSIY